MAESINARKKNLTLEIRINHVDEHDFGSQKSGSQTAPVSVPVSPLIGQKDRSRTRKGAILHHFLHPLDFYHERKLRGSNTSINSDMGHDLFSKSNPNSRSASPSLRRPIYKPLLRRRTTTGSPCPSPLVPSSPCPSPRLSPVLDFFANALKHPSTRYPDGHELNGWQNSSPPTTKSGTFGRPIVISLSKPTQSPQYPTPTGKSSSQGRMTHQRSYSDGNQPTFARSPELSDSSSSSSSNTLSSSSSSSSSESLSGSHSSFDSRSEEELSKSPDKKLPSPTAHRKPRARASSTGHKPSARLPIPGVRFTQPSPGVSPVNKFLVSVMNQDGGRKVGDKTNSCNVPRKSSGDYDDEVFDDIPQAQSPFLGRVSHKAGIEDMKRVSSVERLYSVYEQIIREGQLNRRHSMEPDNDRRRHASGSAYVRGEDPDHAAKVFMESRRLPAAAAFMENFKRSELEEDETRILVKFFQYHHTYDLIPTSAKLVIFDTRLQVKKAFYALVYNGVRAAPLWDAQRQEFVGMLTITDFIRILQSFYSSPNRKMEELEDHRLEMWRTLLNDDDRKLISITPNECLYEAIRSLIHHKIHRLPVIDPTTGNVLYIITHKRILKFLFLYINELPKPTILQKSLRDLNIGTYDNIETAKGETLIIEALNKFVERRISALPIVDNEGKLVDIYAKFDVINLAAEGTYHDLDITLQQANEYRNEWFEGVRHCNLDETMGVIMERIVRAEVHRLVVVDKSNKVIGIISLSDILNELVLKPCHDDPQSLKTKTVSDMEDALSSSSPPPPPQSLQSSPDREEDDWRGEEDETPAPPQDLLLQERKSSTESEDKFDLEVLPGDAMPAPQPNSGAISISG